jgi:hypothetical protein
MLFSAGRHWPKRAFTPGKRTIDEAATPSLQINFLNFLDPDTIQFLQAYYRDLAESSERLRLFHAHSVMNALSSPATIGARRR